MNLSNVQARVEQELNTIPEHLCLSTVFVGLVLLNLSGFLFCFVCFVFLWSVITIVVCHFVLFILAIVLLSVFLRVANCDCLLVSSSFSSDLHRRTRKLISKVHQILDRYKAWIVYLLRRVISADFDYPV